MEQNVLFKYDHDIFKKIAIIYETSEKSLDEDVEILKKWLKTQPHLPASPEHKIIKNLLILHKCSIERTKLSLDMLYTLRDRLEEFTRNCNPNSEKMKNFMDIVYFVPMPKLTSKLYRVCISKINDSKKFEKICINDFCGQIRNLYELRVIEDVILGDVFIYDMKGMSPKIITKLTPTFMIKCFAIYSKVFSTPLKAIYLVNVPSYIGQIVTILKMYLKPKLFNRIYVCKDESILQKHFLLENLPTDYGGQEKTLAEINEFLKQKYQQYKEYFDYLDTLKVNENLRPDILTNDNIFGFYGNFKKLDVD